MQSVYLSVIFHEKHQKSATCRRGGFKKIKGFQKSFRNTATYQKLWGEVPSITRFPLLKCTTVGGMNLRVRPRVDMFLKSNSLSGTHAPYSLLNLSQKVLWEKRFQDTEYRTRLLETVEDFFCQPSFNDSHFYAYRKGILLEFSVP